MIGTSCLEDEGGDVVLSNSVRLSQSLPEDGFLGRASPWPNLALQRGFRPGSSRERAGQQGGAGEPVAVQVCPVFFHPTR
jgi:hypothetical protein